MTVRAHNARQFSDIRRTNDAELHAFIVVLEEPSDAVMGGNGIDMHIGIATPHGRSFRFTTTQLISDSG